MEDTEAEARIIVDRFRARVNSLGKKPRVETTLSLSGFMLKAFDSGYAQLKLCRFQTTQFSAKL